MEHTSSSGKIDQAGHFGSCLGLFVVVVAAMTGGGSIYRRCAPILLLLLLLLLRAFLFYFLAPKLSFFLSGNRIVVTKLLGRPRDEQTRHRPKPRSPTHTTSTTATEFDLRRCSVITAAALFVFVWFFESGDDASSTALFFDDVVGEFDVFFSLALRRRAINGAEEQI
jgi:hypothetical protein